MTIDKKAYAVYIYIENENIISKKYFLSKSLKSLLTKNDNLDLIECNLDVDSKGIALGIEIIFSNTDRLNKFIKYLSKFTNKIEDITEEKDQIISI